MYVNQSINQFISPRIHLTGDVPILVRRWEGTRIYRCYSITIEAEVNISLQIHVRKCSRPRRRSLVRWTHHTQALEARNRGRRTEGPISCCRRMTWGSLEGSRMKVVICSLLPWREDRRGMARFWQLENSFCRLWMVAVRAGRIAGHSPLKM